MKETKRLFAKYLLPIHTDSGTYYAYRHLSNNLSDKLVIKASAGGKLNLAPYLGNLSEVLIEGDVLSHPTSHVKRVYVREDAPYGRYKVTAILPDATTIVFEVEVE